MLVLPAAARSARRSACARSSPLGRSILEAPLAAAGAATPSLPLPPHPARAAMVLRSLLRAACAALLLQALAHAAEDGDAAGMGRANKGLNPKSTYFPAPPAAHTH